MDGARPAALSTCTYNMRNGTMNCPNMVSGIANPVTPETVQRSSAFTAVPNRKSQKLKDIPKFLLKNFGSGEWWIE